MPAALRAKCRPGSGFAAIGRCISRVCAQRAGCSPPTASRAAVRLATTETWVETCSRDSTLAWEAARRRAEHKRLVQLAGSHACLQDHPDRGGIQQRRPREVDHHRILAVHRCAPGEQLTRVDSHEILLAATSTTRAPPRRRRPCSGRATRQPPTGKSLPRLPAPSRPPARSRAPEPSCNAYPDRPDQRAKGFPSPRTGKRWAGWEGVDPGGRRLAAPPTAPHHAWRDLPLASAGHHRSH